MPRRTSSKRCGSRAIHGALGRSRLICAAWLQDTVGDCPPSSFEDIEAGFGNVVADIVREPTDDKSSDKAERKHLKIINAAEKSEAA